MPEYLRAVALDYHGTITHGARPDRTMLDAVREVRSAHRRVILVTGRFLTELLADFRDALDHFDAVVAEDGAVLWLGANERVLASPVPVSLELTLLGRGVPLRRGRVILVTDIVHDRVFGEESSRCSSLVRARTFSERASR